MLRQKIKSRLDYIQELMESNYHLEHADEVYDLTLEVSKFWSILSEEDREYIQVAQDAIENGISWNV
jgi:hypothetical protein